DGVLAYNVISTLRGYNADIVGALYRTLQDVFPQVYWFQARTSYNIVIVATMSDKRHTLAELRTIANKLVEDKKVALPGFLQRLDNFQAQPPPTAARSPILTDDFAPVQGLVGSSGARGN